MSDYQLLLDAPGEPTSRLQIAQIGDFKHKSYGEFSITADDIKSWQDNLARLPGQRAIIDLDHRADRSPRNSEAAGWITGIDMADGKPMADVEWTPVGRTAIQEKRYLFFSPSYGKYETETGETFDNVLQGGALTNKPFLKSLPTISLADPDRLLEAHKMLYEDARDQATTTLRALEDLHGAAATQSDTRTQMASVTESTLKLLDLDDTATDEDVEAAVQKVLDAATEAKPTEPAVEQVKTLEAEVAARDERVKTLETQVGNLTSFADQLNAEIGERKFTEAFDQALRTGRAVAGMRDSQHHFFTLDADATIKALAEGPQIVNVVPSRWNNGDTQDPAPQAPPNVAPGNFQLDSAIKKHMADNQIPQKDYPKILDQALSGQLTLEGGV